MKKCKLSNEDPYLALLNLRNTSKEGFDATPVQRIFGRRTNTLLPTSTTLLQPQLSLEKTKVQLQKRKEKISNYDNGKILPPLKKNDTVRMQPIQNKNEIWKPAVVKEQISSRSYVVQTPDKKEFRRDRQFLRKQHEPQIQKELPPSEVPSATTTTQEIQENIIVKTPVRSHTRTRSSRIVKPPI